MCTICAMTQTFDPGRHLPGEPVFANVFEFADAAENTFTTYAMSVGDSFNGTLSSSFDEDWISVSLVAGQSYTVSLTGFSLDDPYLRVYDSNGWFVDGNDDISLGTIRDSQLTFTADYSGTFYLEADAWEPFDGPSGTGTYVLSITDASAPPPPPPPPPPTGVDGTLDELATFLQEGTQGFSRSYNTTASNQITVNLSGLTADGQQLARWAMEAWEMVADLDFVEVSSGEMITVDDEDDGAFAYYPNAGSTSTASGDNTNGVELNVSRQWLVNSGTTIDSYSFQTYVHEFGHALGLRHQGIYDASQGRVTYENDAYFTNDSWQLSVMSYFSQTENTSTDASYAYVSGAMMADIVAIQDFYGAPGASSATAGNTTYGANSNLGNYMDEIFDWMATGNTTADVTGNLMAFTIYDRDGIDTLDLNFLTDAARLDMRAEQFSDFGSFIDLMGIARGTIIENAILGDANDTVTGNVAANTLTLNGGNDSVTAGDGADTVYGGAGFDTILGGDGADRIWGGDGRDLIYLNQGDDVFNDNAQGGDLGRDTVWAGFGNDTVQGGNGGDRFYGQEGNDVINGRLGNDFIDGGAQFDTISAGEGNDTVLGGDGRDLVFLNQGNDLFTDNEQGGDLGRDTVFGGLGNDTVQGGGGADEIHGEDGNDLLNGGLGNDLIFGGAQRDTINAGDGNDTVAGGDGQDLVFLNQGNDLFDDNPQGGVDGRDTVWAGLGNDTIQGGNGDDVFRGEDGNDLINGRLGNDLIYGGNQFDTINAGDGNDTVFGGNGRDRINLGNGNDRYVDANQTGSSGVDVITGGQGIDTFVFGTLISEDTITDFQIGIDRLELSSALVGGRTAQQVEDQMFLDGEGYVYLFVGAGQSIYLDGINDFAGIAGSIDIV